MKIYPALLFLVTLNTLLSAQNWQKAAGLPDTWFYSVVQQGDSLFANTEDSIYFSINNGISWQPTITQPALTEFVYSLFAYKGILYAGSNKDGVFRSADCGKTWEMISTGLNGWALRVPFLSASGDTVFAGTDGAGIYYWNLAGNNIWKPLNEGLERFSATALYAGSDFLAAGIGMYLYVRDKNADKWLEVNLDSSNAQMDFYCFHKLNDYVFAGSSKGVYVNRNNVLKWEKTGISLLPNLPVISLATKGNRLFAGVLFKSEHFICSSDDNGETWSVRAHEFAGLSNLLVSQDRILAARSDGIWYYDLSWWTSVTKNPAFSVSGFGIEQNYPNPFNPTTIINYSVNSTRHTKLIVYDLIGREIATLVDQIQAPGTYSVRFDAANLSGGVYFYRLSAGNYTETKKMILQK